MRMSVLLVENRWGTKYLYRVHRRLHASLRKQCRAILAADIDVTEHVLN